MTPYTLIRDLCAFLAVIALVIGGNALAAGLIG